METLLRSEFGAQSHGFFRAVDGPPWPAPVGAQFVHAPDLPVPHVQFFRLATAGPSGTSEHVVLMAFAVPTALLDQVARIARGAFPAALVSLLVQDSPARATVHGPASSEVAFAVALVKRTGGWDDSDPIQVTAGAVTFQVHLTHNDRVHFGSVVTAAG